MSRNHQETIACPKCSDEQPFTLWDSINVSLDPDLKQQLFDGGLTTFHCRHCGHEGHVAYDTLYHDMNRLLAIWLKYPNADGSVELDPTVKALASTFGDNYTCRLVTSFHELLDKIRVFDDGFSDHTIELLKLMICIREGIDLHCPFHYAATDSSSSKEKIFVFALETDQGIIERHYPIQDWLNGTVPLLPRILPVINKASDAWPQVNRTMMLHALEACGLMWSIKPGALGSDVIQVHGLGRTPEFRDQQEFDEWLFAGGKTYKLEMWRIGRDVSLEKVQEHRDPQTGHLYLYYELVDGEWKGRFVSQSTFEQLKWVEDNL